MDDGFNILGDELARLVKDLNEIVSVETVSTVKVKDF